MKVTARELNVSRRCLRPLQKGMTLLEVLVVLVLVALLATVLMQGIGYFLGQYHFVQRFLQEANRNAQMVRWFDSSIDGLIAYNQDKRALSGNVEGFSATSMSALGQVSGYPQQISWQVLPDSTDGYALTYSEGDSLNWQITTFAESAAFEYQDSSLVWHNAWPPEGIHPLEKLPSAIRLNMRGGQEFWLAAPDLSIRPLVDFRQ